jgi:hypothetical protein
MDIVNGATMQDEKNVVETEIESRHFSGNCTLKRKLKRRIVE